MIPAQIPQRPLDAAELFETMSSRRPEGPFRVGRSETGLGLFATDVIEKDAFIIEYIGPRITSEEVERRRNTRYLFEINSRWTIDGSPAGTPHATSTTRAARTRR